MSKSSAAVLTVAKILAEQRGFEPPEGLRPVAGSSWAAAVRDAEQITTALNLKNGARTKRDFRGAPVALGANGKA